MTWARSETDRGALKPEATDTHPRFSLGGMTAETTGSTARESELLEAARGEDEQAFQELVEPYRKGLHAHCYRMLGSVHDADDALQDALLRAWRGLSNFQGRSSLRSWLYRIATNVCLDVISRRPQRVLPIERQPASDPNHDLDDAVDEPVWIEPYADEQLGLEEGLAAPEARYEQREAVELAFIVALQHLPGTQRAALILRDVLGFSAREAAEALDTTVPAVNGALRRARQAVQERLPERSQQATLRALGDNGIREVVERYIVAWERGDVEAILALLAKDANYAMPPLPVWYRGQDAISIYLRRSALTVRWRVLPVRANGQLAFASYGWEAEKEAYTPVSLDVLTLAGTKATQITAFVTPYTRGPARERYAVDVFGRFGLPNRLH
jgi:RNA polymerase sigma-70 factor (ECF subfamily)